MSCGVITFPDGTEQDAHLIERTPLHVTTGFGTFTRNHPDDRFRWVADRDITLRIYETECARSDARRNVHVVLDVPPGFKIDLSEASSPAAMVLAESFLETGIGKFLAFDPAESCVTHDRVELRAWRLFGADVMPFLEAALAAQGDAPDGQLLSLQHSLAELLRSPANSSSEQTIHP